MNFRNRKFSDFSETFNKKSKEKGRSKSDALPHKRKVSFKEELFIRNSYDGHLFEKHRECVSRRMSLNIQKQSEIRLPSIVNNVINRRLSLNVKQPIPEVIFPAINAYNFDQRTLFKTKSTQNFSSMTGKKAQGQLNRKGGKRMRRILSLDNFFPPQFKNRILVCVQLFFKQRKTQIFVHDSYFKQLCIASRKWVLLFYNKKIRIFCHLDVSLDSRFLI